MSTQRSAFLEQEQEQKQGQEQEQEQERKKIKANPVHHTLEGNAVKHFGPLFTEVSKTGLVSNIGRDIVDCD